MRVSGVQVGGNERAGGRYWLPEDEDLGGFQ